jgi:hypothetical protein
VTNWTQIGNPDQEFNTPNPTITFGPTGNINTNPAVNVTPQANGTYALDFFGFGFTTYNLGAPQSGLFYPLSPGGGYSATLALDFQGLGLPENLYNNFVSALTQLTTGSDNSLTCQQFAGGICRLKSSCSTYKRLF